MTVLVTGASGTVGSEVVRLLHAAGVPVRAGSRHPDRIAGAVPPGVAAVYADVCDPEACAQALAGVGAVFLVRPPQVARPAAMAGFIAAAQQAGVRRVAFLSVQGAGSNPLLPHRGIERLLERSSMDWTFLRAGYFMQNLLTVHRDEVRGGEVFVPAGAGATAIVDARDVAAAAVAALTQEGHARRAYELTAQAVSWAQVAQTLTAASGHLVRYEQPGLVRYVTAQVRRGKPLPLTLVTAVLYSATRLHLSQRTTGDLAAVLGRAPRTLADFTADHADAWR